MEVNAPICKPGTEVRVASPELVAAATMLKAGAVLNEAVEDITTLALRSSPASTCEDKGASL